MTGKENWQRLGVLIIVTCLIGVAAFSAFPMGTAQAASDSEFFSISIFNALRADQFGYPRNDLLVFSMYRDGVLQRQVLLRERQRAELTLPAGWYSFALSTRHGKVLAWTGTKYIAKNTNVRWQANFGPGLQPRNVIRFR